MPIQVVCPGCKKRFQVSEKFAGKQGPCPSCKAVIRIPDKGEEVTIHAPDEVRADGKTVTGQPTFKPIRRTHLTASPITLVSVIGGIVVVLAAALLIGLNTTAEEPVGWPVLAVGSILLAFPIVWGGYTFVRDPELGSYRGMSLYLRIGICALVYVLIWGIWSFVLRAAWKLPPGEPIELYLMVVIIPAMIGIGALAPFATFDLDYTTAALHYGFYLGICVLLRVIMHLPVI